jgi:hypothetical protein
MQQIIARIAGLPLLYEAVAPSALRRRTHANAKP